MIINREVGKDLNKFMLGSHKLTGNIKVLRELKGILENLESHPLKLY